MSFRFIRFYNMHCHKEMRMLKGEMEMNITSIIFGILFIVFGLLFGFGKLYTHISVWKNMPQEEKEKIDIVPLCRNIGEVILLSGIIFLLKGLCPSFTNHWFRGVMLAWLIVAILDILYISKSKRYKK